MVAALTRPANKTNCSLMRFSMSPRAQYSSSYNGRTAHTSAPSEVTMKTRIRLAVDMFGLGHHTAALAPGSAHGFMFEFDEDTCGLLSLFPLASRFFQSLRHFLLQHAVARPAKYILNTVAFAPVHQLFLGKSRSRRAQ